MISPPVALLTMLVAQAAGGSAGDGLARLRAALGSSKPQDRVGGTLAVTEWASESRDGKPKERNAHVRFHFDASLDAVSLRVSSEALGKARAEAGLPRGSARPNRTLIGQVGLLDVERLVDAGAALLRDLDDAQLLEDRPDASQGRPGRALRLKLKATSENAGSRIKVSGERFMQIWIGEDGFPLASDDTGSYEGGFLMLKGKGKERTRRRYQRLGDRLITIEESSEREVDALGEQSRSKRTWQVQIATKNQPAQP